VIWALAECVAEILAELWTDQGQAVYAGWLKSNKASKNKGKEFWFPRTLEFLEFERKNVQGGHNAEDCGTMGQKQGQTSEMKAAGETIGRVLPRSSTERY